MLLVVTGGDDNALVFTNYLLTEDNSIVVLEEQVLSSAHCTQITGAQFLAPRGNWLVSTGVDQRLRLWQRAAGSLQEHCSRFSCIPDIAAFACWRQDFFLACTLCMCDGRQLLS
ncbi:hypothetical protein V5799_014340 [Amblyomma americanum]|uniref:Uncharacterized protein n=1 Tax=Amblyomma americanum TaxID=6943 RepID=A0AAQ4E3C1_AMBAM